MTMAVAERFEIGRVISRMFQILRRNAGPFSLTVLLLGVAPQALWALVTHGAIEGAVSFLTSLINIFIAAVVQGALIFGSMRDLGGRRPELPEMARSGLSSSSGLVAISFIVGLGVFLASILLIAPGVILALMWCVAAPARVVEGPGVRAALGRSRELTRGHRWSILALSLLFVLASAAVFVVFVMIGVASGGPGHSGGAGGRLNWFSEVVIVPLLSGLLSLLGATAAASLYHELRTVKDGAGADTLAAAFA